MVAQFDPVHVRNVLCLEIMYDGSCSTCLFSSFSAVSAIPSVGCCMVDPYWLAFLLDQTAFQFP